MVLEEAATTPDTFSSDSAPPSDADPYHGDRRPTELSTRDPSRVALNVGDKTVYIDVEQLPKSLGLLRGASHTTAFVKAIDATCQRAQQALGRPVKQEEADAFAFHLAKGIRITSYGEIAGTIAASVLAWKGRSKWRFPFYTPGEWFSPAKLGPLRGRSASITWQFLRCSAYFFAGTTISQIFFGSYALAVCNTGRAMDPRLKDLIKEIQPNSENGVLPGNRQVDRSPGPKQGETFDMARQRQQAQDMWRASRAQREEAKSAKAQSAVDDVSPTGGAFEAELVGLGSAPASDTAMMDDDQARRQSAGIQKQQETSYARSQESRPQGEVSAERRQEPTRDVFSTQNDSRPAQGGSAWDKVRQQASSGKPAPPMSRSPSATTRNASSSGDTFTFSSSDEEKQLAKAEAQEEFDARIDRERSGKDFEDKKRW